MLGRADGRLYVLDVGQKQLSLLPRGPGKRYVMGGAGHGPGELMDPVALTETREGRLFLLDRGNQRMDVYRTVADSLERVTSLPLDFVPEDACALGERLFVLGPRGGYLIHEVSPGNGRVVRSLVSDPASRDPMLSPHRAAGFVQCGPGEVLTVLPLLRPEISRYSSVTGQRLGRLRIPRYRATRVGQDGSGVVYRAPPGGQADYGASLTALADGRMLVQIGPVRRGSTRYEHTSLRTFVLSWSDSTLTELAHALPRIGYVRHDTAIAVLTDPGPALTLLPLRLDGAVGDGT
ncbi:MAG TPA: hypothetical protein VF142_10905 [Longimicrobium sp.]